MTDPFSTTAELAYKGKSALGENLLGIAGLIAQQKSKERLLEKEAQLKAQYPDPFMAMMAERYGIGNIPSAGAKEIPAIPTSPEEAKLNFIKQNPQYKETDIATKPVYSSIKGQKILSGYEPELNQKAYEQRIKNEEKNSFVKEQAQDALNTIGEVEKGINYFGLTGQLPSMPGTQRTVWETNVNKLLSGKIINLMTQMKEASKTGATGFGQLSERELAVLQEASTALKRGLPPKEAQKYLNEMKLKLQKITSGEQTQGQIPSFNSEQEAEKSGIKGVVIINGKKARID